ncbi:MAG: HPr family phosphocarrier protein [Actinomycetaceae bacterium]|nr:HPr family phosphocarrier protein [Arcanobacterium sp.]MDD7687284.1 HPr family phosphocarrier protein [Actinomycetaceae bacterium]MDY5273562.1 HPr family phosphocarrier protein [Arcanobacterium sp.]
MISRTVKVGSPHGLHARPAAIFANAAGEYEDIEFTLTKGDESADAASLLEVMTLGAEFGDEVTLSTDDDSATEALEVLAALLEENQEQ